MKVFIDTCIPMYAAGREHPLKAGCLEIMRSAASGNLEAYTDTEVFQEILYRYFSINQRGFGLQLFDSFSQIMHGVVLPVRHEDMIMARTLANETCIV
ncbi:MAG: type II toxin-antitoxin system VapC family toxin [Bacillota bacterium]